jgi:hypothetical protein
MEGGATGAEVGAAPVAGSTRGATTRRGGGDARARFDENSPGPDRRRSVPGLSVVFPPLAGGGDARIVL